MRTARLSIGVDVSAKNIVFSLMDVARVRVCVYE